MKTGIVILNYHTFDETLACFRELKKGNPRDCCFYIVDNGSPDDSAIKLKNAFSEEKDIKLILSPQNLGFSGGNNLGIRQALEDRCDCVYLLNSDILMSYTGIEAMNTLLFSDEKIAVVGPRLYNGKHTYCQYARKGLTFRGFLSDTKVGGKVFSKSNRYESFDPDRDFLFQGMCSGACFGLKASYIDQLELLDDHVFLFYEEDILAHLLKDNGLFCAICANAPAVHLENVATDKIAADKLCFTRFYRWVSSVYVLRNYRHLSLFLCLGICLTNILVWSVYSLFNREYRKRLRSFIQNSVNSTKKIKG